jgi:hypothetical protein
MTRLEEIDVEIRELIKRTPWDAASNSPQMDRYRAQEARLLRERANLLDAEKRRKQK